MRAARIIAGASLAVTLFLLINFYIGLHAWWLIRIVLPSANPILYWMLFTIFVFGYIVGHFRFPQKVRPVGIWLGWIGSYYLAIMEFAVIVLPVADLVYWILRLARVDTAQYVFVAGIIIVVLLALFLIWGSRNAWSTIVRKHDIHIHKQVAGMTNLRIAVASDIHLSNIVGNRHLSKMVKRMNAMNPDLILLVGDVLDNSIEPFIRKNMSVIMKELKAKYGVYAVLGNHEYYGRKIEQYVGLMDEIGIKVLQDEVVEVGDAFYIVGRKDKAAESMDPQGRKSVALLLDELDHSRPIMMMDHQPYRFDLAAAAGVDLLLCGHTHRGQFAPNHWITRRLFELDWGYMRKEHMHVIVSSGYGTWGPPIRIASRSELVELNIVF